MRICQLMAGEDEGGLETHFVDLANGLAALGDEVTAIAHERYRERFAGAVRFLALDLGRGRRNLLLRRRLRGCIRDAAPHIVHAQAGKAAALLAAVGAPCPTVGTVHNIKRDLGAYRRFDAVIGVSRGVLARLDHPRKRVVYNGVGPPPPPVAPALLRRWFGIDADAPVALAAGRMVAAKRFDRLIDAWRDDAGHLVLVGDGPDRRDLARRAAGRRITFAGFRADARALMGGADAMVFASDREGFSYAMAEALRARLPIVSTPVPGAEELLPQGHLAAPGQLGDAIAACLADPAAARSRMAALFDWAAETLTIAGMTAQTRRVYAEVLA